MRLNVFLVDGAPEIVLLTPNIHEEFIQVPRIAQPTLATLERTSVDMVVKVLSIHGLLEDGLARSRLAALRRA